MPTDKPDDMDNPAFSPRQLAQLDERFKTLETNVDVLSGSVDNRFGQVDERLKTVDNKVDDLSTSVDKRFDSIMTREETTQAINSIYERFRDEMKVMLEPILATLAELVTVKPRVDTLVAAELPSRVGRLERKVFPPAARSRRQPAKRSRGRRG